MKQFNVLVFILLVVLLTQFCPQLVEIEAMSLLNNKVKD